MKESKVNELLDELSKLKYTWSSGSSTYDSHVINKESMPRVDVIIRQYLLDSHDEELGELKAKCYAYEKIIANSNFAPMLDSKPPLRDTNTYLEHGEKV